MSPICCTPPRGMSPVVPHYLCQHPGWYWCSTYMCQVLYPALSQLCEFSKHLRSHFCTPNTGMTLGSVLGSSKATSRAHLAWTPLDSDSVSLYFGFNLQGRRIGLLIWLPWLLSDLKSQGSLRKIDPRLDGHPRGEKSLAQFLALCLMSASVGVMLPRASWAQDSREWTELQRWICSHYFLWQHC